MIPADHATRHRLAFLRTLQPATLRPRRPAGDLRIGTAVLVAMAVLAAVSLVIVGAGLATDIRETRAAVERCR